MTVRLAPPTKMRSLPRTTTQRTAGSSSTLGRCTSSDSMSSGSTMLTRPWSMTIVATAPSRSILKPVGVDDGHESAPWSCRSASSAGVSPSSSVSSSSVCCPSSGAGAHSPPGVDERRATRPSWATAPASGMLEQRVEAARGQLGVVLDEVTAVAHGMRGHAVRLERSASDVGVGSRRVSLQVVERLGLFGRHPELVQCCPQDVGCHGPDREPPVVAGRAHDPRRGERRRLGRQLALQQGGPEVRGHRLQLREVDVPAGPAAEQVERRDDGGVCGDHVAEPERQPLWCAVVTPRLGGESRHRCERVGERHGVAPRSVLAGAGHRDEDDVGVELTQPRVVQPPLGQHAGAEVLDHDVDLRHQPTQQVLTLVACAGSGPGCACCG